MYCEVDAPLCPNPLFCFPLCGGGGGGGGGGGITQRDHLEVEEVEEVKVVEVVEEVVRR